jgi:hypothetical protein
MKNVLIYIPSYFDFITLRNFFKKEELGYAEICEYTDVRAINIYSAFGATLVNELEKLPMWHFISFLVAGEESQNCAEQVLPGLQEVPTVHGTVSLLQPVQNQGASSHRLLRSSDVPALLFGDDQLHAGQS